jgi:hypothetical protein
MFCVVCCSILNNPNPTTNWSELGYKGGQILQHTTQNIKDWATRTPQKTGVNSGTKGVKYYNRLHRTLKTEQHEPHKKLEWTRLQRGSNTTTHYTEHYRLSNTSPTKNWSELGYKGGQIQQHTTQNIKDSATRDPLKLTPFIPEFTPVFCGACVAQSLMICVVCCSIWPPLYWSSLQFCVGLLLLSL